MTMVSDLLAAFNGLDVQKEALVSISKTSEKFVELNREQLQFGKRADGSFMPPYSRTSVIVFGKPSGPIRLYDTGAFQKSFKLDVSSSGVKVVANDIHGLEERYSDEIYGLGNTQQEFYNQEIFLPEFAKSIEAQTGLKL